MRVLRILLGQYTRKVFVRRGGFTRARCFGARDCRQTSLARAFFLTGLPVHGAGKPEDDPRGDKLWDSRFPNAVQRWRFHDVDVSTAVVIT